MNIYSKRSYSFYRYFTKAKLKCLGKIGSAWFVKKKLQFTSTTYKLFRRNVWWNYLELSNKMGLNIPMRIFKSVKHRKIIYFKFWDILLFYFKFFTSLTMLGLKSKASICFTIKENIHLYSRKISAFCIAFVICYHNSTYFNTMPVSQRNADYNRNR